MRGTASAIPLRRTKINYRANIWALHSIGAEYIVAVSSVISINDRFENGALVLPDDLIDYTYGRKDTFFEGQEEPVVHTDFLEPYTAGLREKIVEHAQQHQMPLYTQAVYGCLQGPRWRPAPKSNVTAATVWTYWA